MYSNQTCSQCGYYDCRCSMISNGEVITSSERMDDFSEVMMGYEEEFVSGEDDVDESQEWHDFDPDC